MARPLMDKARVASNVDKVQTGNDADLKQPYTGKGVIVSLYDTGLDPNHINFLNDDESSRVKGITVVSGNTGAQEYYEFKREIASFTTENANETHGTHVLGIAAGRYNGEGKYAGVTGNIPYYGVATDADLVIGCGDLYNNCILKGVQYAIDKSKELNQPAVINLSLGSNTGSHDGKDSFNRALGELGKEAIIVVSAGNEGDLPMGLTKEFVDGDTELKTFPSPYVVSASGSVSYTSSDYDGTIEIYSSDERPFKCSVVVFSRKGLAGEITDSYVVDASTGGKKTYVGGSSTPSSYIKLDNFDNATSSTSFFAISSNVDTYSKRYSVVIEHQFDMSMEMTPSYIGLIIEGEPGQRINMYASCNYSRYGIYSTFVDRYMDGWSVGSPDGSINNMACGENVIAIGSYNTRKTWPVLSGAMKRYPGSGYDEGAISPFSSYGTMLDGSTLPSVAAPGCGIISSISGYYTKLNENDISAKVSTAARNYHWENMQGTSMSSPYAAGVFATWLEADPTLTIADIKSIVKATSIKDSDVTSDNPARWGAGKLDALAGIKEVIRRADAGVDDILADSSASKLIVEALGGNRYSVFLAGGKNLSASLFSLSGAMAMQVNGEESEVELDASTLAPGVYVLDVTNGITREATKIVVK